MHQALPYKPWHTSAPTNLPKPSSPLNTSTSSSSNNPTLLKRRENLKSIVEENAVIVFGRCGCCMSHVVSRLLLGLGVNPTVYEVDEQDEQYVIDEFAKMGSTDASDKSFPVVFIGGRWFGGLDRLIATHISGELTPILREAGALWL